MNKSAFKRAMARTRARRMALAGREPEIAPGRDAASAEPAQEADEAAEEASLIENAPEDHAKSTRSPPVLMLVIEEEEEVEFCAQPGPPAPLQANRPDDDAIRPAGEAEGAELDPPFDPPDLDDLLAAEAIDDDEEPPFDPADAEELAPVSLSLPVAAAEELVLTPANENGRGVPLGPVRNAAPEGARDLPAPAIRIYLSWDRLEAAEFFKTVAADPRLSRAETTIARGGLDGAAVYCAAHQRPDLIVIDTTLRGASMLASLDRLMESAEPATKIIVLGAVNDVTLLRELAQRGVDEYLVWPVRAEDLAGSACALFAESDTARVIAVVGARGGIGASTIARNLAWCMAERQHARTTLVDLDLPFGTAAFGFKLEPARSLADVLDAGELTDVALDQIGVKHGARLTIVSAPAHPGRGAGLEAETAHALIAAARRLSTLVVLDLPHLWAPWVKQALLAADEIVLVSSPDLASLRNTDNIAKFLRNERNADPVVALSMAGVPKRPEVPFKEFANALGITPACTLLFEPNVYGAAALTGQMLGEIAPGSKAAALIDELATLLTGREAVESLAPEPAIFEGALPKGESAAASCDDAPVDPFESALVNPFALQTCEEEEAAEAAVNGGPAPKPSEQAVIELAPLDLLEPARVEPDYLARARAAALEELDAIETSNSRPHGRVRFGSFAVAAAVAIASLAAGGVMFNRLRAAPAPASAATVEVQAPQRLPPAPPSPQQLAAEYETAAGLIEQGASDQALAPMQRLANAGFVMAQYRLAKMYERGEGVAADLAQARLWTERAAAGGNRHAMHDLGVYYARGEGAPRDEATALRWFQQAAELGLADSQYNVGLLYEQGRGVEANPGEALFWFRLAASQGDEAAAERASALESGLTPFDLEQVDARLAVFQPNPADAVANGDFAPPQPAENAESAPSAADSAG